MTLLKLALLLAAVLPSHHHAEAKPAKVHKPKWRKALASVYGTAGDSQIGNLLGCGGTFTPGLVAVAHKSMPCGARLTLGYRRLSVRVRVRDRGPYVAGRTFDLTAWEKHNGSSFHADRFRRVHEQTAHFYRGKWEAIYKSPVTTADATQRTVRRKGRPPHMGEIEGTTYTSEDGGPRLMRSVIRVRSMHGRAIHETEKPTGYLVPLIEYSCPPDGVVLDPFAGSASTLEAACTLGRQSIGIEIDPTKVAAARERLASSLLFTEQAA